MCLGDEIERVAMLETDFWWAQYQVCRALHLVLVRTGALLLQINNIDRFLVNFETSHITCNLKGIEERLW